MYHISNDIRMRNSAQQISNALLHCAKRKPFQEITISELHKEYGISRTTFYRLFDNIVDVLEYQVDLMGREILLSVQGDSPKELTINAITALKERWELIDLLSRSGYIYLLQKKQEEYLPLSRLADGLDLGDGSQYFHGILAHLLPTALEIWIKDNMTDTPEEVYEKLSQSIRMLGTWF
ncbi:TetR/AcrR family transcriptional regulator [Butyricicoccus sp.]|uniref:TetR/AcrR family transcriptional regulator n=1 Tax=Butyricicoccus sp. TaxID=2049021 RepID=UPI003F18FDC4